MYEIALTRIFSVSMWYHFAFVAISVALFGMTVGALIVHLFPHRFSDADVKGQLWRCSALFAIAIVVCFVTQLQIPFTPHLTAAGMLSVVATCLVVSVPFVFSGIVVCLALTRFPGRVNRLYAVDLVGAALGCVLLVVLLAWIDAPSLVLFIGAIAALGALVFALDAGHRRGMAAGAVVVVALVAFGAVNVSLQGDGRPLVRIMWTKEHRDEAHDFERWNAFSRLTVDGDPKRAPFLNMVIDSAAGTALKRYTGDPSETDFLRKDVVNLAHWVRPDSDVLVIGVGGGKDILSALEFDQRSVTGVEINPDILDVTNRVYGEYTGHLDRDRRVSFVNDEARSYLARTDRRYDIIQISLIDTWAATSAGAFALSENTLYTKEAWDVFFDSLEPGGVLSVTRWYEIAGADIPLESYRNAALAAQALADRGVENPRDHMLIYREPSNAFGTSAATLLVSPEPFAESDIATLGGRAEKLDFTPVLTPERAIDSHFAEIAAPGGPGPALAAFTEDLSPPTDNRPFFFLMADQNTLFSRQMLKDNLVTRPVLVLAILALSVLALAALCIALPLVAGRRAGRPGMVSKGMLPFSTYFAGIGLGFLLIEIAQLQRLSMFLGNPTYGLTVVLFSVLLFSGVGSMLSERIVRADRARSLVAPLVALLVIVGIFGFVTPHVIRSMAGATTPVRVAIAVALMMPMGLVMGMPFSIGMRAAAARAGTPTAFLWGINGATSVCGSVFGIVIALFFGISAAFWAGALAYGVALVSMGVIARSDRPAVDDAEVVDDRQVPVPLGAS